MKFKFAFFTLGLLLIQPAFAVPLKPEKCPGVAALAAFGVDSAGEGTYEWMAFPSQSSRYDTNEEWSFGIFIHASSREEAIEKGRASIKSLVLSEGPYHDDDNKPEVWTCAYGSTIPHVAGYAFSRPRHVAK